MYKSLSLNNFKQRFRRSRRGLETVTAVLMLFLMFTTLITLVYIYFQYNLSLQEQMRIEQERSQEKIVITQLEINNNFKISNITITNTGTIEIRIRALYQEDEGVVTFLTDPSTYMDTHIPVGNSKKMNLTSLGLTPDPSAVLIAATERGTRSQGINEISLIFGKPPTDLNTSQLTIGPLMLSFNSLQYTQSFDRNGNPTPPWVNGWVISKGTTCAWRLNVTNVDPEKRDITINQFSGFTISNVGGTQAVTWYLYNAPQTLIWNQAATTVFLGESPGDPDPAKVSGPAGIHPYNVFLTFIGNYTGGNTFAQTIPFEAITVT